LELTAPKWCNHSDADMIVCLLALILALAVAGSATRSSAAHDQAARAALPARSSLSAVADPAEPRPLRGVPLRGATGLRLLVANDPPLLLDVDTGRVTRIAGLSVSRNPVLSVLAVGKDAIVSLVRRAPATSVPRAEVYVIRHGTTRASPLATAWEVASAADGAAVWLKSYEDARHCTLRELSLDGRERRSARRVSCSAQLIDAGVGAVLVQGNSVVDPQTGRTLLHTARVWAMVADFAVTAAGSHGPLTLTNVRSGERWRLGWPSEIGRSGQGGADEAAVEASGKLVALSFSDPAYQGAATQVTDVWLLDATNRRFHHLPDMPAAVSLKSTSMSWTNDGRLVILGETARHAVVAIWERGQERIAVRRVWLPSRNSGSESFVIWRGTRSR
jgi:hypothetical protein